MLPSGLPERVGDAEELVRFLNSSSHFNSSGAKVSAFLPPPSGTETSVFRIADMPREGLWEIASRYLQSDRNVHAAAIITAADVRAVSMDVVADEPPPRHANITGWAVVADPELAKAQRKEQAASIALRSRLLRPH